MRPATRRYKPFYVAQDEQGKLCGHQHVTARKAVNCGGNAYRVTRKRDKDDRKEWVVTFTPIAP